MIKLSEIITSTSSAEKLKEKAISLFKRDKGRISKSMVWSTLKRGDEFIDSHADEIIDTALDNINDNPDIATQMYGQELVSTLLKLKTTR